MMRAKTQREQRRTIVAGLLVSAIRLAQDEDYQAEDRDAICDEIVADLTKHGLTAPQLRDAFESGAWDLGQLAETMRHYLASMDELSKMASGPLLRLGPGGGYTRDIHDAGNKDGAN